MAAQRIYMLPLYMAVQWEKGRYDTAAACSCISQRFANRLKSKSATSTICVCLLPTAAH